MSEKLEVAALQNTRCSVNDHILTDCQMAGPAAKPPEKRRLALAEADTPPATPKATSDSPQPATTPEANAVTGQPTEFHSRFGTEEQFMKYAPKAFRSELGLPANASSEDVVNKMMASRVQQFQKQPDNIKRTALEAFGIDQKKVEHILGHKPDSNQQLKDILLGKEEDFLQLPHQQKLNRQDYVKLEDAMLRDDYKAITGVEKILKFRQEK